MKILEPILDKKTEKVDKTEPWRWKRNHESSNRSEPINRTWPAGSLPRASSEITGKYPHESRFGSSIPRTACDASLLKLPFSHSEYSPFFNLFHSAIFISFSRFLFILFVFVSFLAHIDSKEKSGLCGPVSGSHEIFAHLQSARQTKNVIGKQTLKNRSEIK